MATPKQLIRSYIAVGNKYSVQNCTELCIEYIIECVATNISIYPLPLYVEGLAQIEGIGIESS